MAAGDHIFVQCSVRGIPYQHHGIDLGDGTVAHLAPESGSRIALADDSGKYCVRRDSMEAFAQGRPVQKVEHIDALEAEEVVATAIDYVGRCGYHLLDNNCEHFASLCKTGRSDSRQVDFGHRTAVSITSAATKSLWTWGTKVAIGRAFAKATSKVAVRPHPMSLLADGVEAVAIMTGCAVGLSAQRTQQIARAGGELTAVAVGCVVGGPVGGAVSLAIHRSSTQVAEHVCNAVRNVAKLKTRSTRSV